MVLSVVIPVRNVATWINEALDSVLAQTGVDLEVIAVDNGSTDNSAALISAYQDPRVHLITHPAGGTGGARNVGVQAATGEYLTFVDPDDIVIQGAWQAMLNSLTRSGSDFVVGHFERLHPDGSHSDLAWAKRVHHEHRTAIDISALPEIVGDVFVWNKMFRTSFWKDNSLLFPENTRYQDQPVITEAFLRAKAFDVLPQTVYLWRVREDKSSVTQRRDDVANLHDRVTTKANTWAIVQQLGSPAVIDLFHRRVMAGDLHHYFAAIPGCSDAYWDLLTSMVRDLWGDSGFASTQTLPVQRLIGWLVGQGRRSDATSVAAYVGRNEPPLPVSATSDGTGLALLTDRVCADEVPETVRRLRPHEWGWRVQRAKSGRQWRARTVTGEVHVGRLGATAPFEVDAKSTSITVGVPTLTGTATLTGPLQ